MKKARMNISHSRFILSKLKIFGEIVTTYSFCLMRLLSKVETRRDSSIALYITIINCIDE